MSNDTGLLDDVQPVLDELESRVASQRAFGFGTLAFVNAAAPSANTTAAAPAAYNQAHIQSLIDELRDLKTKLREPGILST